MFLLDADGRNDDVVGAFARYGAYLDANQTRFPASAYALASSDWWFDPRDHRCPHDGWIERVVLNETDTESAGSGRLLSLGVTLRGAYHDRLIELHYPRVYSYALACSGGERGHRDWRYDELRVTEHGRIIHEIEWWGPHQTGRWIIEASDLEYRG